MAKQTINIGTGPNTGTGEAIRSAFTKVNENFTEVYTTSNTIYDRANSGIVLAQLAFDAANSASGNSISGYSGYSGSSISGYSG